MLNDRRERVWTILQRHGVERAHIFGSVARHEASASSDLDLLVEMPDATFVTLADLRADLEDELGIRVDVTTPELLVPEAHGSARRDAVPL